MKQRSIAILTGLSLAFVAAPAAALAQSGVIEKPGPNIPKVQEPPVKRQLRNMIAPGKSPAARKLEAKLKANAERAKLQEAAAEAEAEQSALEARRAERDARLGEDRITLAQANGNKCARPKGTFLFNVEQEDIRSLLKKIARITCKNYIISEGVKGKNDITIISHREVTVSQAERAFLAALEANNMALIPTVPYTWQGKTYYKYYKVVERKEANTQPLPMYEDPATLPNDDGQVTLLYQLQYAGKDQVEGLLKGMMSKSGDLRDIGGDLLIITDSASNIRRLVTILEKVDVSGSSSRMHIVDVRWAEATQISQKLTEIFNNTSTKSAAKKGSKDAGGDDVTIDKIIADERTNKLIIICSVRAFKSVRDVIDILDRPDDINSTATQVYVHPLNNADAQKTSSTLSSLAQGSKATNSKAKGKAAAATSATLFEGEVKITADEATNALVIVASARDYNALKKVIADLDVRRPQVYIEAAIMEVSINENRRLSLDAYAGVPADIPGFEDPGLGIIANEGGKSLVTASAQTLAARELFNALTENSARLDPTSLTGVVDASTAFDALLGAIAFQGPGIPGTEELFGFTVPSFGFVLNALQSSSNVNILSTPHIMTTDNEKAEISVGERVPVLRGFTTGAGGGGALGGFGFAQNVSFEDVKLKFTVTPHVNDSGEIRCEIEQEVSDIGGSIAVGGGIEQPIITSRTAKTTVVVRDQQSVVLGGLISDRKTDTESKFPLLGDIPIIGWLFKNWSDTASKTNLMLVLTPYVVRDEGDFAKIYDRKMKERREFVEAFYGRATDYNPYVDYGKKTGPMGKLIGTLDFELQRIENGGAGIPGEEAITPETPLEIFAPPGDAPSPPGDEGAVEGEAGEGDGEGDGEASESGDAEASDDSGESSDASDSSDSADSADSAGSDDSGSDE